MPARIARVGLAGLLGVVALGGCGTSHGLSCSAQGVQTERYVVYDGVAAELNSLDLYLPAAACDTPRPVVVWVHGGGWQGGDKLDEYTARKVALFTGLGYVFASVNYRLTDPAAAVPVQWPAHDDDVADAIGWLVEHAAEYGGDPDRIAALGHSAGGGIVAAVATDPRYLAPHGLGVDALRCAASMDGEGYDIVAGATTAPEGWREFYTDAFGDDPAGWVAASPIRHVAPAAGIPRFFIASRGTDWRLAQHLRFITGLDDAGVPWTALEAQRLEHIDLTSAIGAPDDGFVTPALLRFLASCFA